ncbi:cobyrinate a,c-diamide synthase [Actinacidiphila acidipaludis]|uniref:Hydrogenobyrinate a,c-diamide synthase n=1 Tax=Actinacidiphila acidipaludis TaxID=2873382 RepID=A0ABS7QEH7_9ACTN|nr:cobyrinate a,c-diamide synthase [Streptomyces acidipaludis]MBY8880337.1 cobyrinate a,c-diamide synthase [Streptomyces acidipaludis]
MTSVPRLVVAAPASGSGKTTVATGLMAAFAARGLSVSPHKVGPDYIDPGYHALATGRPGRNLDPFLSGEQRVAPLFLHGAAGCELAVVEGVMGLFDGVSGRGELGSTAQVAKLLRAPVVLVVDAASQARSVAALVHGFASWDTGVRIGGVILNRVGSDRHEAVLREALDEAGVPVLGALRRDDALRVPSRHLGLVPAAERRAEAAVWIGAAAERVRAGCDLAALWALARSAPPLEAEAWSAAEALDAASGDGPLPDGDPASGDGPRAGRDVAAANGRRPVVAVAAGAAFSFAYPENTELLAAAGADVVHFDPLADEDLPEDTAGIVVGGGFPEVHAPALSANAPLRARIAAFRGPVAAECAGLLYLVRDLDGAGMCGVLDATATMTDRLTLGYREAVALGDSVLTAEGGRIRGHEFHRTQVRPGPSAAPPAWGFTHPERRTEGFAVGNLHASYLHLHWSADPSLARRFVERCAAWACV